MLEKQICVILGKFTTDICCTLILNLQSKFVGNSYWKSSRASCDRQEIWSLAESKKDIVGNNKLSGQDIRLSFGVSVTF